MGKEKKEGVGKAPTSTSLEADYVWEEDRDGRCHIFPEADLISHWANVTCPCLPVRMNDGIGDETYMHRYLRATLN